MINCSFAHQTCNINNTVVNNEVWIEEESMLIIYNL